MSTARVKVVLACEVCGGRNYKTTRSTAPSTAALKMKKYCATCGKHTVHQESR
ncbi:MAG: 50S ribosomal protein L33 [Polyangiaceae bacterium]|nr:50S ribosomal protein L33 [Polyangiaceae bacterium]